MVATQVIPAVVTQRSTQKHIPELDGLRGVAILLVLVGHATSYHLLAVSGVSLFFVLSGFLITRILVDSASKPHYFRNFYIRRALRIWPLYFLILGIAYLTPLFPFSHAELPAYRFLLYIQNFWSLNHAPPILGTTWSLAIEEQFYMVWPLVIWLCRTPRNVAWMAAVLIAVTPAFRVLYHLHGVDPYALTFGRMDGLAMGAGLASLTMFPAVRSERKLLAGCLAVAIALLPLLHFTLLRKAFKDTSTSLLFIALLGFAFYWSGSKTTQILRNSVLRFFGRISYCAYLIHLALIYKLGPLVAISLSVAIATISWYLFEQPILRWKDRLTADSWR